MCGDHLLSLLIWEIVQCWSVLLPAKFERMINMEAGYKLTDVIVAVYKWIHNSQMF